MWPVLIDVGPFRIYTYGVLIALAFIAALTLALRLSPRYRIDKAMVWDWLFYILIGALIGARALYLWVEREHLTWSLRTLTDVVVHSGGVFYGGLAGAILASVWFLRRRNIPLWHAADLAAAPVALGQGIGRLGCFFAGCCWGKPTNLPWAVTFDKELTAQYIGTPLHVPLHPTQLYESLFTFALAGFLLWCHRYQRRRGDLWWLYLSLYAIFRFFVEFLRADPRGHFWIFSTSQWIALLALVAALVWLRFYRHRQPPLEQPAA